LHSVSLSICPTVLYDLYDLCGPKSTSLATIFHMAVNFDLRP